MSSAGEAPAVAALAVVAACTRDFGIGRGGALPWAPRRLHLDMAFLRFATTHRYALDARAGVLFGPPRGRNVVVMGRKTWESIPPRFRPMEGRVNIVVTRDPAAFSSAGSHADLHAAASLPDALAAAVRASPAGQIFVLGGAALYREALAHPGCECVLLTRLLDHPPLSCDVFFPHEDLASFGSVRNITQPVFERLLPTLPAAVAAAGSVALSADASAVAEGDFAYKIEVCAR